MNSQARQVLWTIIIAVGSVIVGLFLWLRIWHPCLLGKATLTMQIESEADSCTLVDLLELPRTIPAPFGYGGWDGMKFFRDDKTGTIVLRQVVNSVPYPNHPGTDWYRIKFSPPGAEHFVPDAPETFQPLEPQTAYLRPEGGLNGWTERYHGWPREDPSLAVFRERGHAYQCPGTWALYASDSPAGDFLVLITAQGDTTGATYLGIYRRRDHSRLLQYSAERCYATADSPMSAAKWISDTDFVMITGSTFSDLVVCRFRK